ncbi:MAG: thioredoxin family protein, partial [Muribaculaceae bacterium]|nr:thioredoxin family protein [Muribaculaceae bacterium]
YTPKSLFSFLIVIAFFSPFYIYASNTQPPSDNFDKKHITTEELRLAEETVGNPESDQYDEDKFCNVLRRAIDAGILNEADRLRATYRIEIAAKNRPGTTASDFNFLTRSGKRCNLLGFNSSKPILLFFYDPDCDHCMQTIAQLKQTAIPDKAEVVAIYAEDDRERWEETNSQLPEDWTVGYALDPIQDDETYIFLTSPTLYLLTPQKTILLKDTTLTAIEEMLQTHGQNSPDKDE